MYFFLPWDVECHIRKNVALALHRLAAVLLNRQHERNRQVPFAQQMEPDALGQHLKGATLRTFGGRVNNLPCPARGRHIRRSDSRAAQHAHRNDKDNKCPLHLATSPYSPYSPDFGTMYAMRNP